MRSNPLFTALTQRIAQQHDLRPLIAVTGVVLLLVLTLWLKSDNLQLQENLSQQAQRLEKMRRSAEIASTLKSRMPSKEQLESNQSLLAIADQTIRSGSLEKFLTRIEPDEKNAVNVWFDNVAFDTLLSWLTTLQKEHGVGASRLTMRRTEKIGMIQARITLTRANAVNP